uniref:Uncharacterized protein n=1 Tax=uncultured bacterium contig00053 TaxID=1181537 RepID=A0A806KMY4_9BACT|nr:hypothetical protein [uncultured bacterium contig00053]
MRVERDSIIGSSNIANTLNGLRIFERLQIIIVHITKITAAPMQNRMKNLDMILNVFTSTAVICSANRQIRANGSKYNNELKIFWKACKIALHRFINSEEVSPGRYPIEIPKTMEKNRIANMLPSERA